MSRARVPARRVLGTPVSVAILLFLMLFPLAPRGQVATLEAGPSALLRMSDEGGSTPTLEPAMVVDDPWIAGLVFGGLVGLDPALHIVGDGADTWQISPDGRTYSFHIRPGLRSGDGALVTAQDFAWSLNRALSPQFSSGMATYYLGNIHGADAVTNKKAASAAGITVLTQGPRKGWLQIVLDRPSAVFLQQLTFPTAYVVPRVRVQRGGDNWTANATGTGPFRVRDWRPRQVIILEPNPYYWRGKIALRELDIQLIDADHAFDQYRLGNLDVMGAVAFPSNHLIKAQSIQTYHPQHLLLTDYLLPNLKRHPFDTLKVRQAFAAAVNRVALASTTLSGTVFPATGILPPGMPGYNAGLRGQVFDPVRARTLLVAAGYPKGKGLPPVSLLVDGTNPASLRESAALQATWRDVLGVTVSITRADHASYEDALTNRRFQLALTTWAADYPDPQDILSLQLQTNATGNLGGYSNRAFDRLTVNADTMALSNAARYPLYQQAEQIATDEVAWIVLDWGRSAVLIRPNVRGLVVTSLGVMAPDWTQVTVK